MTTPNLITSYVITSNFNRNYEKTRAGDGTKDNKYYCVYSTRKYDTNFLTEHFTSRTKHEDR